MHQEKDVSEFSAAREDLTITDDALGKDYEEVGVSSQTSENEG